MSKDGIVSDNYVSNLQAHFSFPFDVKQQHDHRSLAIGG